MLPLTEMLGPSAPLVATRQGAPSSQAERIKSRIFGLIGIVIPLWRVPRGPDHRAMNHSISSWLVVGTRPRVHLLDGSDVEDHVPSKGYAFARVDDREQVADFPRESTDHAARVACSARPLVRRKGSAVSIERAFIAALLVDDLAHVGHRPAAKNHTVRWMDIPIEELADAGQLVARALRRYRRKREREEGGRNRRSLHRTSRLAPCKSRRAADRAPTVRHDRVSNRTRRRPSMAEPATAGRRLQRTCQAIV